MSIKQSVIFHLAKEDSVNEAGELLWVMKGAHIVFSLLLAQQTPILVFPLLVNTGACVSYSQELTPETPPESGFLSVPVPLPLEQCLVLQVKVFKTPSPALESVCPGVFPVPHVLR